LPAYCKVQWPEQHSDPVSHTARYRLHESVSGSPLRGAGDAAKAAVLTTANANATRIFIDVPSAIVDQFPHLAFFPHVNELTSPGWHAQQSLGIDTAGPSQPPAQHW
jgi:hypothetical protein